MEHHEADDDRTVTFKLGDMIFEYDEEKNRLNIKKHGIPFSVAARVFFDYDRIEAYDAKHSADEPRYDTIGDVGVGNDILEKGSLSSSRFRQSIGRIDDIMFVVYTERCTINESGRKVDITRLISARLATSFERGLYYGKYE